MKENILGINVCTMDYQTLISAIDNDIKTNKKSFCVAINPEKVIKAKSDPKLKSLLNRATYQIPDGTGIVIASRIKGGNINSRITGIDLMDHICKLAEKQNYKIYLYGAKPGIANQAKQKLEEKYPDIKIVGTTNGYEKNNDQIINNINASEADILFVAMGSPRQEEWIIEHLDKVKVKVFQGVGGSFDVLSGDIKRAPLFFRKFGLEWAYRLLLEPSRIKRQLALPRFLYEVIKSKS